MAESLSDRADLITYEPLLKRVRLAIVSAAIDVAAEPTETPNHTFRATLAQQILRNPGPWADVFVHGVLVNPNVGIGGEQDPTDEAGDSSLQYVVNSLWDAYASTQP